VPLCTRPVWMLRAVTSCLCCCPGVDPASGALELDTHFHSWYSCAERIYSRQHELSQASLPCPCSADIPMLVAGDFNSIPGSPAHGLLTKGRVEPNALDTSSDPLGILRDQRLSHQLPLSSAYGMLWNQPNSDQRVVRQKQRLHPKSHEPQFTNYTREFKGTLDYILFTHDSLMPMSLLELPSDVELAPEGSKPGEAAVGLPNAQWSSDHVALLAEFHYLKNN
jgi:CCR4-NOT transcription complex subunit 6